MGWTHRPVWLLTMATLAFLSAMYIAVVQSPNRLSPQGCRMSRMYPSYILQTAFDANWTRLAQRYTLWLYREVGVDSEQLNGLPVLFIPGNAGSSRQVRSIASSAARQYYSAQSQVNPEFKQLQLKPLDFFAVDFNEDFSALHGPTLLSQREYTSAAISYILSLYSPNTKIIVMGHSMGGIVALSLLPSSHISAIITMSTPHSLPPARLDQRIEAIYSASWTALKNDSSPVLSICGGATDLMIPSETCSMEHHDIQSEVGWRKTIFTTCMEGTWTGVGHQEMVWCHQVRWRVARAALELGGARTASERGTVLDRWFRDTVKASDKATFPSSPNIVRLPAGHRLFLRKVHGHSGLYILPITTYKKDFRFSLFVSRGALASLSPHHTSGLRVSVFRCIDTEDNCQVLEPDTLRLLPDPDWGKPFPVPHEGIDESQGIVHFEVDLPAKGRSYHEWIAVSVEGNPDPGSWIVGGIDDIRDVDADQSTPLWRAVTVHLDPGASSTHVRLPKLLANTLLVYRLEILTMAGSCKDALLPPLILHRSGAAESYFHPTSNARSILIHTHTSGPFVYTDPSLRHGLHLHIFSSGECGISEFKLTVDWWSSLATWGLRYWTTVCAWAVSIVGGMLLQAWYAWELGDPFPSLFESIHQHITKRMLPLGVILFLLSCLPAGPRFFLGNAGELMLAPLAPLLMLITSGCVAFSCIILQLMLHILSKVHYLLTRGTKESTSSWPHIWSWVIIFILIGTTVPSQVAFIVCFVIHLFTCAALIPSVIASPAHAEGLAQNSHILLLMVWLLPLAGPVLAVWVRTLATAGFTTPFDGDHDVLASASFLLFVDFASRTIGPPFERAQSKINERLTYMMFFGLATVPLLLGGRYTYVIYTMSNIVVTYLCIARIGRRLWK